MDKYGKKFIRVSLIYLGLGMLMGIHMSFADHAMAEIRFIHVHLMLIGFMAMFIYGVAYHILPRFNARQLPYPSMVPVHYWLANAGLVGLIVLYGFGAFYTSGAPRMLFGLFGLIEGVSILIFIVNMLSVLKDEPEIVEEPASAAPTPAAPLPDVKVAPGMKIAEILEKYPHLEETMTEEGLGDLANSAVRDSVAQIVTLEMAAKKAGKELFPLIARLEGKKIVTTDDASNEQPATPSNGSGASTDGEIIKRGELAHFKTKIGPLLEIYPETTAVFEKHYGSACFTCPGQATENIEQTAGMHGMPPQKILDEINGIIETTLKR